MFSLAEALGQLTSSLVEARTMLWCCLQLGTRDIPRRCIDTAKHRAYTQSHHRRTTSAASAQPHSTLMTDMDAGKDICNDGDSDEVFVGLGNGCRGNAGCHGDGGCRDDDATQI